MSLMDVSGVSRYNSDISSASDKDQAIKTRGDKGSATSSSVINAGPVDADIGRHIVEGLEAQLPEFIEFSLLGKNRNYLQVNSLRQLQGDIQQSIESLVGDKGSLPESILDNLSSLRNGKDKNSVFNYFGTFIEEYIHFRQRNYDGNTSGQKILSDRNRKQQGLATDKDKHKQQTDLLASRLSGYLAQTFTLLRLARETDLSPWRETENRAREDLIKQLLLTKFHALNLRGQMTEDSLSGESLTGRKLNSLIHAATWKERRARQQGLATTAGVSDRAEPGGSDVLGALLEDEPADPSGGLSAASIAGELPLLLQGIELTRKAAVKLQKNRAGASLSGRDLEFLSYISGSCEKLAPLITELHTTVENALPAGDLLKDSPKKKRAEKVQGFLTSAGQAITTHAPFILRPFEKMAWRVERVLTAQLTKKTDPLRDALGRHTLTAEEKSVVLQAGGIVKDLLQQAMANINRIHRAAQPLLEARQHQTALEDLLAAGDGSLLDSALRHKQSFWQTTVAKEQTELESFIEKTAVLSRGGGHDNLKRLIREVLSTDAQSQLSADTLKELSAGLTGYLVYLVSLEKQAAALPARLAGPAEENLSLSAIFTPWLRELEAARSLLNAQISQLAGREPASFSRSGMLAKGIAVWHQERKAQWLQNQPAEGQEERGKQYDAAFQTLIKNYLPLLAKQHDRQGDVLLQRIKTEMVNAEVGTTLYPTTMAEMLHTQKGMAGVLQNSAIRSLVRLGISAIFGSVGVLPSLAALPLRIVVRSLLTGAQLAYVSRKGAAGVRLGEGSTRLEARQYRQTAVSQGVAKTAFGLVKPVREAAGLVSLLYEIYQGDAKGAAGRVARELPAELAISSVTGTIKAVVLAHIARQSAEENEQTREALQRLSEEISATDDATDADPIGTMADGGEEVAITLEAIANNPGGPAGSQPLAATLLKRNRARRAAGEPPLRLDREQILLFNTENFASFIRDAASSDLQEQEDVRSTVTSGLTENEQRLAVHRGVSENSPHKTARNGWRPLTSIDQSDFDLHPGECIEYSFNFIRNGQKTTKRGRVRIPADQRTNLKWHTYFSQQLNHIIFDDPDLLGVFDVQFKDYGKRGNSNLSYLDRDSHYNAVYVSEASHTSGHLFTWNIATEPVGQGDVQSGVWDRTTMPVHAGMQREDKAASFEGWQPLTSLSMSDYDLPTATKIEYAFSYEVMENGQSESMFLDGSIKLHTGKNRDWHRELGVELNKIIRSCPGLSGLFEVDTLKYSLWSGYDWGRVQSSHYNNMYVKVGVRGATNHQFLWRIEPKAGQLTSQPIESHSLQESSDQDNLLAATDTAEAWEEPLKTFITELLVTHPERESTATSPLGKLIQSETESFRLFLKKYPRLASLLGIEANERNEARLLAASRQWYKMLSGPQQDKFDFAVAFFWKLETDAGFREQIVSQMKEPAPAQSSFLRSVVHQFENAVADVIKTRTENEDATYHSSMRSYNELNKERSDLNLAINYKVTSSQDMLVDLATSTDDTDDTKDAIARRDRLKVERESERQKQRTENGFLSKYAFLRKKEESQAPAGDLDEAVTAPVISPSLISSSDTVDNWIVESANKLALNINKGDLDKIVTITWRNAYTSTGEEYKSGSEPMTLRDVLLGEFARKSDTTPLGIHIFQIQYSMEANPDIAAYLNRNQGSRGDMIGSLAIADDVQAKAIREFDQLTRKPGVAAAFKKAAIGSVMSTIVREAGTLAGQDPVFEEIIMHYLSQADSEGSNLQAVTFEGKTVPGLVAIGQGDFRVIFSLHTGTMFFYNARVSDSNLTALIREHVAEVDRGGVTDDEVLPWYSNSFTTIQGIQTRSHLNPTMVGFSPQGTAFTAPEGATYTNVMVANFNRVKSDLNGLIYTKEESRLKQASDRREIGLGVLKFTLGAIAMMATAPEDLILLAGLTALADYELMKEEQEAATHADRSADRMKAENAARSMKYNMYFDAITGGLLPFARDYGSVGEFAEAAEKSAAPGSWSKPVDFSKYTARDASYLDLRNQVADENGVYAVSQPGAVGRQYFIQEDGRFYRVKFDDHLGRKQGTMRLVDENRNVNTGYHEPIRRNAGGAGWEFHNDTGLPGGVGGWGSARIPLGDNNGQPIRGSLGNRLFGEDNPLSAPRTDLAADGTWPGERGTMGDGDESQAMDSWVSADLDPGATSSSGYSSERNSPTSGASPTNTRAVSPGDNVAVTEVPVFPGREPIIPVASRADLSDAETAVTESTKALLPSELGSHYNTFLMSPRDNCAEAAKDIAPILRRAGYSDVEIHELGFWLDARTGREAIPTNHYVVMAKKDGVDIVVDLTAGQFEKYGFTGPIISTKNNWLYRWQQALKEKPRTLVKMVRVEGGVGTSPFAIDINNSFDWQTEVPNATLLQSPAWYKPGG
ncbi:hypothetical protein [Candidatus Pantoea multigeneris]|uniref:Tox-PLDMTX domain-containing protein n=1 Tax=Candidatus Pantoea multigeneris TaxID=2608357 RepID=A0ABX0RCI3_9GAMM|nr:hypothetical protein [Pantoea multigeneris]NIF22016.1 hypothetical protein [Pantoea multigeneris]